MVLFSTFLIAVLAQISVPVPFSPVPITGQTIGVVLVGSLLGSKKEPSLFAYTSLRA